MAKTLIAFFSRADENYFGGAMRYVKVGNTEIVAGLMKELIDADTFKIEMKDPYSPVYMTCIEEAKKDKQNNARPELTNYIDSIDEYDTIVLGYPNYWGTFPMAVATFLERYDFTGKTILPLCTNEGKTLDKYGIKLMSWYPLGHGDKSLINESVFAELGKKYGKSSAQIILRWHTQMGFVVIPGSKNVDHIKDNLNILDFKLTDEEMRKIAELDKNERYYHRTDEQLVQYAGWKPDFEKA